MPYLSARLHSVHAAAPPCTSLVHVARPYCVRYADGPRCWRAVSVLWACALCRLLGQGVRPFDFGRGRRHHHGGWGERRRNNARPCVRHVLFDPSLPARGTRPCDVTIRAEQRPASAISGTRQEAIEQALVPWCCLSVQGVPIETKLLLLGTTWVEHVLHEIRHTSVLAHLRSHRHHDLIRLLVQLSLGVVDSNNCKLLDHIALRRDLRVDFKLLHAPGTVESGLHHATASNTDNCNGVLLQYDGTGHGWHNSEHTTEYFRLNESNDCHTRTASNTMEAEQGSTRPPLHEHHQQRHAPRC